MMQINGFIKSLLNEIFRMIIYRHHALHPMIQNPLNDKRLDTVPICNRCKGATDKLSHDIVKDIEPQLKNLQSGSFTIKTSN